MAPVQPQPAPLSLPQYMLRAGQTNRFSEQPHELEYLKFGYFGEVGGLLAAVKKSGRDQLTEPQHEQAAEELGDGLWYLVATAARLGVSADDLGIQALRALRKAFADANTSHVSPVTFRHLDGLIQAHRDHTVNDRSQSLASIAQSAGVLANMTETQLQSMSPPAPSPRVRFTSPKVNLTSNAMPSTTPGLADG